VSESATASTDGPSSTVIGADTVIEGRLLVGSALTVRGRVHGAIARRDGSGPVEVRIEQGALVEGDVLADIVVVDGGVAGHVTGVESVRLGLGARVRGDVTYGRLDMDMDVVVEGRLVAIEPAEMSNVVPLKP
jgi:cytoskeletal protein CcmA (bactofilin family)